MPGWLQELEEDPEMRQRVALFKDQRYDAAAAAAARLSAMTDDDDEDDVPEVSRSPCRPAPPATVEHRSACPPFFALHWHASEMGIIAFRALCTGSRAG